MMLHELTTNAVKYGALSVPMGRIRVEWSHAANGSFFLRWTEMGGPSVKPPTRQGFGTRVLERALSTQFHGKLRFDWRPNGLRVRNRNARTSLIIRCRWVTDLRAIQNNAKAGDF